MSKHTGNENEWKYDEIDQTIRCNHASIARMCGCSAPENAERILTCVKAMAGIDDPAAFVQQAKAKPAPVDAMREALEAIADAARRYRDDMLNYQTPDGARNAMASLILLNAKVNAHETIKAALAAAKEKA